MTEYVCDIKQDYPGIPYEHDDFSGTMERREEVVRCRDCKNAFRLDEGWAIDFPCKFNCIRYSQWDYYDDEQGMWLVEPDGFCAWGRKRES